LHLSTFKKKDLSASLLRKIFLLSRGALGLRKRQWQKSTSKKKLSKYFKMLLFTST